MALATQSVPVSFTQGLDTKTDDKQVIQGKLLELENGVFTKAGKINKRFGYDAFSGATSGGGILNAGAALGIFNTELCLFTGSQVLGWVPANDNWINRGNAVSVIETNKQIIADGYEQLNPDCSVSNGLEVYAWEDFIRGQVRYSVLDTVTKAFLVSDALVDGYAFAPKVLSFNNYTFIFYVDGAGDLKYRAVNSAAPTVLATAVIVSSSVSNAHSHFDAMVLGGRLYIAFNNSAAGTTIVYLNSNFTVTAFKTTSGAASSCLAMWSDASENIWIALYDGSNVKNYILSFSGSVVHALTTVETITASISRLCGVMTTATTATIFYESTNGTASKTLVRQNTFTLSGTAGTASVFKRSVGLASKPFSYNGAVYINLTHESASLQNTYFTVDSAGNIVAKQNALVGGGLRTVSGLPEVNSNPDGVFIYANSVKGRLLSQDNIVFTLLGVGSSQLDFEHANKFQSVNLGNNLHIVGGILQSYDSVAVVENNFHLFPEGLSATTSNGGGSMALGTYLYVACYEWTDNYGQIHRSSPSIPLSVTIAGSNNTATLTIPTLRLTNKSNVRIVVYRTEAGGAVNYYRVSSVVSPLFNDPTVDTKTFTDGDADLSILSNELVYTTGGILGNDPPPPCSLIASYKSRIFLAGLEDKNVLWFSKTTIAGAPVEFSAFLTMRCDSRGGDIKAIAVLDDKLIIFKEYAIFVVAGDGPSNTGDMNDYGDPQLVTSDSGCINPNSVVITPEGIMYQSAKGLCTLTRSLSVEYTGAAVEAFNDLTISSAVLMTYTDQVRFTTEENVILVYDYYYQQWSTFTGLTSTDSDVWNGSYVLLNSSGQVMQENLESFVDGANAIKLRLVTSWLSFAGLQNFQRVRRMLLLGEYKGAHQLIVNFAYDFSHNYAQQTIIDASHSANAYGTDIYGADSPYGGVFAAYQYRIRLDVQKCEAIKVSIEDNQSTAFNEGYDISALNFEVGVKKGAYKLVAGNSVGSQ